MAYRGGNAVFRASARKAKAGGLKAGFVARCVLPLFPSLYYSSERANKLRSKSPSLCLTRDYIFLFQKLGSTCGNGSDKLFAPPFLQTCPGDLRRRLRCNRTLCAGKRQRGARKLSVVDFRRTESPYKFEIAFCELLRCVRGESQGDV